MEQTTNTPPESATNEPASPSAPASGTAQSIAAISRRLSVAVEDAAAVHAPASFAQPLVRTSDRLSDELIESAVAGAAGRRARDDGWTPQAIRAFLEALAECGVVGDAARAAGMGVRSAYAFRNSAAGRAFDLAWRAALVRARGRLADEVMSRALHGCVDVIVRDGEVWGERHRYDNRLTMAVLTRLDNLAKEDHQREIAPRAVAAEFDRFVDIVCEGGAEAADFIRDRCESAYFYVNEAEVLDRAADYLAGPADA